MVGWLGGDQAVAMTHAELEDRLGSDLRKVVCQLFQDHLDLRAGQEGRLEGVTVAEGTVHGAVEAGHRRGLVTVFGKVTVSRLAYRHGDRPNLHPADATLGLPVEVHSHGLRRSAAVEASRGSFDEACAAIERACGQHVPKRQVEELVRRSAVDFEAYYEAAREHRRPPATCSSSQQMAKG